MGTPVNVDVLNVSGFRWRSLPDLPEPRGLPICHETTQPVEVGQLDLNPELALTDDDWAKLNYVIENIQRFADTWNRNRVFDSGDDSPSSYDMSIAAFCRKAGTSQQTAARAIIHWRRMHGMDIGKAMRQDYMQRTIGKVWGGTCEFCKNNPQLSNVPFCSICWEAMRAGRIPNV